MTEQRQRHAGDDDESDARHGEPAVAGDDALECLGARTQLTTQVGVHHPEHAGDDVAEEQHHAQDVQRLDRQIEHVS